MAATLGFISVRQHAEHGYFGGYLVVNHLARPLEFHCTLPVKPTRAQVLLYGPTMDDFVCGEQIAKALITKAKLTPDLIVTDTPPSLAAALVSDAIMVCLEEALAGDTASLRHPTATNVPTHRFTALGKKFLRASECNKAEAIIESTLKQLSERFELTEPFSRIVEALFEAHPVIKAA